MNKNKQNNPVFFSVNDFDSDGDLSEQGVYLHFDSSRIKVAEDLQDYRDFISELQRMEKEIAEIYRNI